MKGLCVVTQCVNPDHLEAVTPEENSRRRRERERLIQHIRRSA